MSLIDEVKKICNRLAPHGWRDLLLQHGIDITAEDLKSELIKELPNINRRIKGFLDISYIMDLKCNVNVQDLCVRQTLL